MVKDKEERRKYQKEYYKKNRVVHLARVKKVNKARAVKAYELTKRLKSEPCADCKKSYPYYVMDFDHLPEYEKKHEISNISGGRYPLSTLEAELKKCEVVCSNCHRERTYSRRNK